MPAVTSADGTRIACERSGTGPALIIVDGALCHRGFGPGAKYAALLEEHFAVTRYDRRGRGESGPGAPWSLEREVEDLAALIEDAGGSAALLGFSSGAALSLEAGDHLDSVTAVVVYEPPFVVDPPGNVVPDDFIGRMHARLDAGERSAAVKQFMRFVGAPAVMCAVMSVLPMWKKLKAVAHTLPWDLTILAGDAAGRPLPPDRWAGLSAPVLAMAGGKSPEFMRTSARALAANTGGEYRELAGQTHMVKPAAIVPEVVAFLQSVSRPVAAAA